MEYCADSDGLALCPRIFIRDEFEMSIRRRRKGKPEPRVGGKKTYM
jgi:hypothetical protein